MAQTQMALVAGQVLPRARALLPPLEGGVEDLLLPLYQGVALLVLRVLAERFLTEPLRRFLKARSYGAAQGTEKRAKEVLEQAFCVLMIAPLTATGWYVLLRHNGPCTPLAPKGCLVGWPGHPVSTPFRWWWLTLGGMYTGEMIGTALGGVGFKLPKEMVVHHAITLVMMLYGYFGGLHRFGLMATTVLDTSNGFLHAAKLAHASGLPQLAGAKDALFKTFALVFFVVRVVLPPLSMVVPGLVYGRVMPLKTYLITNALMASIYALQLMWFQKILRIAGGNTNDKRVATYTPTPGATPVASPRASLKDD